MSEAESYKSRMRGASKGAGWGMLVIEGDGSSWLNTLSLGDVAVFDDKADAEAYAEDSRKQAALVGEFAPEWRARQYKVERVEAGAWKPSHNDSVLLRLMPYAERAARAGDHDARDAVNDARARLSVYAPIHLRVPPSSTEGDAK